MKCEYGSRMPTAARGNVITSYGLYWDRDEVDWEHRQMPGRQGRKHVNFWEQSGVYVLFRDRTPFYVGISPGSKATRQRGFGSEIGDHLDDRYKGWNKFSW